MTIATPTDQALHPVWARLIRWLLGLVFVWAGGAKIAGTHAFFLGLLTYELPLPEVGLRLIAITFPWLELFAGVALLLNFWAETIRLLVVFLCALFVILLAQATLRGLEIDCSCFSGGHQSWLERREIALPRAVLLLTGAVYLSGAWRKSPFGTDPRETIR